MKAKTTQIIICMILMIFLGACSETTFPETSTSVPIITTSTPTQVPAMMAETRTPIPNPSATSTKTATPQPTNTATQTNTIQPTPTIPRETLQVLETIEPLLPICEPGGNWELSPSGQWISEAECRGDEPNIYSYVKVLNISDSREWRVDFDETKLGYYEGVLWPEQWTNDGRFLYMGVFGQIDGGGFEFVNATSLLRLNLETGEIIEILPNGFHTFALSAEGYKLAYVSEDSIDILDMGNWITNRVELNENYCRIGDLLWSPNETEIMIQTITCAEDDYYEFVSYNLIMLDLENDTWKQILSSTEKLPASLEWKDTNPVYFEKDYTYQDQDKCWMLNLDASELQPTECP